MHKLDVYTKAWVQEIAIFLERTKTKFYYEAVKLSQEIKTCMILGKLVVTMMI